MKGSTPVERTPQGLREARVAVGLSQAGLAAVLVVNHASVSRWESGMRRPPHDLMEPLSMVLGVPVDVVGSWFAQVRWLKGDGMGQVPGLKHLLRQRGVGLDAAAEICGVSVEQMRAWVFGRRTLQRAAVVPLAGLLGVSPLEFIRVARRSPGDGDATISLLRSARLGRRLTQVELGRRVGVAGETVSHWERGTWTPPVHQVFRLARVLGVDAWELGAGLGVRMPERAEPLATVDTGVGGRLQDARLREGLTRPQLARCIGVRSSTVGRWEAGRSHPSRRYRERLESVLGVGVFEPQARMGQRSTRGDGASVPQLRSQSGGQRCA